MCEWCHALARVLVGFEGRRDLLPRRVNAVEHDCFLWHLLADILATEDVLQVPAQ